MERRPEIMAEVCKLLNINNNPWYTLALVQLCLDANRRAMGPKQGRPRRFDRRFTVEESRVLPAQGWDQRPRSGTWTWPDGGCIGYQYNPDRLILRLVYTVTSRDE